MARTNKVKEDIKLEIRKENGGSLTEISSIIEHSLEFTRYHIEKGEFAQVRLPYFGKFHVNPQRLKKLNNEVLQRGKP